MSQRSSLVRDQVTSGMAALARLDGKVVAAAGRSFVDERTEEDLRASLDTLDKLTLESKVTLNSTRPLVCLPKDVTQEIFRTLMWIWVPRAIRHDHGRSGWFTILWICHALREIGINDTALFAMAYTQLPQRLRQLKTMAKGTPLWCVLDAQHPYSASGSPPNSPSDLKMLAPLEFSISFRSCGTITLKDRGPVSALVQKLVEESEWESMTLLQDLTIWASERNAGLMREINDSAWSFVLDTPHLRRVSFDGFWIPFKSGCLERLEISAKTGKGSGTGTPRQIHGSLLVPHASSLRYLYLENPVSVSDETAHFADNAPSAITFPALRELVLVGSVPQVAPFILGIRAPALCFGRVNVVHMGDEEEIVPILEMIATVFRTFSGSLAAVRLSCTRDYDHDFVLSGWNAKMGATADMDGEPPNVSFSLCTAIEVGAKWPVLLCAVASNLGLGTVTTVDLDLRCKPTSERAARQFPEPHLRQTVSVWLKVLQCMYNLRAMTTFCPIRIVSEGDDAAEEEVRHRMAHLGCRVAL